MTKLVKSLLLLMSASQMYGMDVVQSVRYYTSMIEIMPPKLYGPPIILQLGDITNAPTDAIVVGAYEQKKLANNYELPYKSGTIMDQGMNKKIKIKDKNGAIKKIEFKGKTLKIAEPYKNFESEETQGALFYAYRDSLNFDCGEAKSIALAPLSIEYGCSADITSMAAIRALKSFMRESDEKFKIIYLMAPSKVIFDAYQKNLNRHCVFSNK